MALKIYQYPIPSKIMDKIIAHNIVSDKDIIQTLYLQTFFGKIEQAALITDEKFINWLPKEKTTLSFKKIKQIKYDTKGIYATIIFVKSNNKTFELKLNLKDGEIFYNRCLHTFNNYQNS